MAFSTWSELAAYVAQGHKANIAHLAHFDLASGPFRAWPGRYVLNAFGETWYPTGPELTFASINTDNAAFASGSEVSVKPKDFKFIGPVIAQYEEEARFRAVTRYMAVFDGTWENVLLDRLVAVQLGLMDQLRYSVRNGQAVASVTVEGPFATQRIASIGAYTAHHLKQEHPTALGLDFQSVISGSEVSWPIYN